jgi:uncharacterized membrane protein YfcA
LAATVLDINVWLIVLCIAIVTAGAALQASIGIGFGMLSAPILGLVDTDFVPTTIVLMVIPLSSVMAIRERSHVDRRGMSFAVAGRIPGAALGAWVASVASTRALGILIGISVLIAVIASLSGARFSTSSRNLTIGGMASGFTGTATGVGGPPIALTYQHADPQTMRATLATFFTIGALMSVLSLAIVGVLGAREIKLSLLILPGVLLGLYLSRFTIGRLSAERLRPIVLSVCSASALALLIEHAV